MKIDNLGLMYYRARYYDPQVGRFISQDKLTRGPDDPRVSYANNIYALMHGEITLYSSFLKPHEFNRYMYVNNNPVGFTDPLGLDIEVTSHQVVDWKDDRHAALKITPNNQKRWKNKPFMQKNKSGDYYLTLSAGRSRRGKLISDINRPTDKADRNVTEGKVNVPGNMTEDQFISELLKADLKYKDNLNYAMWPKRGTSKNGVSP